MKFHLLNLFFLLSTFLFAQGDSSEHDHSKHDHSAMTEMDSSHHSMSHGFIPIGIMGNMHHKGFMLSIKHGRMKMDGNILDGKNISDSEIDMLLSNINLENDPNYEFIQGSGYKI